MPGRPVDQGASIGPLVHHFILFPLIEDAAGTLDGLVDSNDDPSASWFEVSQFRLTVIVGDDFGVSRSGQTEAFDDVTDLHGDGMVLSHGG